MPTDSVDTHQIMREKHVRFIAKSQKRKGFLPKRYIKLCPVIKSIEALLLDAHL